LTELCLLTVDRKGVVFILVKELTLNRLLSKHLVVLQVVKRADGF